jgi:hypothetical protein
MHPPHWHASTKGQRSKRAICANNTRMDILQTVRDWFQGEPAGTEGALRTDGNALGQIFWLDYFAGTSKSTIAQTIAYLYDHLRKHVSEAKHKVPDLQPSMTSRELERPVVKPLEAALAYHGASLSTPWTSAERRRRRSYSQIFHRRSVFATSPARSFSASQVFIIPSVRMEITTV